MKQLWPFLNNPNPIRRVPHTLFERKWTRMSRETWNNYGHSRIIYGLSCRILGFWTRIRENLPWIFEIFFCGHSRIIYGHSRSKRHQGIIIFGHSRAIRMSSPLFPFTFCARSSIPFEASEARFIHWFNCFLRYILLIKDFSIYDAKHETQRQKRGKSKIFYPQRARTWGAPNCFIGWMRLW